MGAVDGQSPAPPELRLSWECEKYHCLPETGGYYDQEYNLMRRMVVASNIYTAYSRYRNAQGAQIHNLSDGERRILRGLIDMKLIGA